MSGGEGSESAGTAAAPALRVLFLLHQFLPRHVTGTEQYARSVALELREAESCEAFKVALPKALKDGDRRSLHLLAKLTNKRGCGPKKTADCFACLRDQGDELTATINAVKSRRPPSYPTP